MDKDKNRIRPVKTSGRKVIKNEYDFEGQKRTENKKKAKP